MVAAGDPLDFRLLFVALAGIGIGDEGFAGVGEEEGLAGGGEEESGMRGTWWARTEGLGLEGWHSEWDPSRDL